MFLPEFKTVPYYKIKLPISGRDVSFRPYYVGEEISFMTHIESQDKKNLTNSLIDTVKACTKEKDIFDDKLSLIDFSYLLVNIRAKSKGEKIELEKTCSKCKSTEPFDFDVLESLVISNKESLKCVVDIHETLTVEIGVLPFSYFIDCTDIENENDLKFFTLASSLRKIIDNGNIYSKFETQDAIDKLLKKLSIKQLKSLVDKLNDLATMKSVIKCECPKCGHKDEIEMDNILSFLF